MYKIKEIRDTCFACPSQWEGFLENGKAFYIRYRWGYLSIRVADNIDDVVWGEEIFGKQIGGEWDGCIDLDRVLHHARDVIRRY